MERDGDKGAAPTPTISLPKGGGALRGIDEKLASNLSTGTATLTVPIPLSAGRGGFGVQLALSYDSGAGNGPFGIGWTLSAPAIARKTDRGIPEYRDAEESDVYVLSGSEDLVPVRTEDGSRHEDLVSAPGYAIHRYRPRVEGLFARIERWTHRTTGEIHWRSITKENLTTLYGIDDQSRVFDPADPTPEHPTTIFRWLICSSYDDKGNAAVYEYVAEDDAGVDLSQANERNRTRTANRYLKRIKYGNRVSRLLAPDLAQAEWLFEVVLDYGEGHHEDLPLDPARPAEAQHRLALAAVDAAGSWSVRPDPFSTYRSGFEVRSYRRCQRVLMFHRFPELGAQPCLVRSLELAYADLDYTAPVDIDAELAHAGSTRFASQVYSMTQCGYVRDATRPVVDRDGVAFVTYVKQSMPALELGYSKAAIDERVHDIDATSLDNLPIGLDGSSYRWVDLDGEGVSGILSEEGERWSYKANLGDAHFGPVQTLPSQPQPASLAGGQQQLLDLSGDGQLDVVAFAGTTPGFFERSLEQSWQPLRAFQQLPNLAWAGSNLRFVDLDGDGHADALITDRDVFTWFPSRGEDGFAAARTVRVPVDEERGPRLVVDDGTQSIYLADLSGDGLQDLVRIQNGEVCYWPNLGHGRFGARVTMDNAPWFDHPEQFEQRRLRLADIDGSGTTDLIYLGRDGVRLYFNQAGNRWSPPRRLPGLPPVDGLASITAVDLLGNGTTCLVWSSPLAADARRPMRYIDLMGRQKPYLLTRSINNLGAETLVDYAPSTKFYLADKRAGTPWITRIPFPVQVVERVHTYDRISRNRFVSRYDYHHGHFDGEEREFRGFGLVDQYDTEELATLNASAAFPAASNVEAASHVPPVLTRTWFHTGARRARDLVPAGLGGDVVPGDLSAEEEREAFRALKGSLLRKEIYARDGSDQAERPYLVTEQTFAVQRLQGRGQGRHGVFFAHPREALASQLERALVPDPRVTHAFTLVVDPLGNVLESASIAYGRQAADAELTSAEDAAQQTRLRMTCTENRVTGGIDSADAFRAPLPYESQSYQLTGLALAAGAERFSFAEVLAAVEDAALLDYERATTDGLLEKRLIEHTRTVYRRDDLTGPLQLGQLESRALTFESYKLGFTPGLVAQVYGARVTDAMLAAAGYVHGRDVDDQEDAAWWLPSGRSFLSPEPADGPAQELAYARAHFFQPHRFRDPFHTSAVSTETIVRYDGYDLLLEETRNPFGSRVTVGERNADPTLPLVQQGQDYRVLRPSLIMDANRNRSRVAFDALGLVVASALMGKPEDTPALGDRLDATVSADLTQAEIDLFFADPSGAAAATLLGNASTRTVYDLTRYAREPDPALRRPGFAATLSRETHVGDALPPGGLRIQVVFSYSDGFGREIQQKLPAEPGPGPARRWVGTGWTVFNNKGKPVRKYEPYFTADHDFELAVQVGVSPIRCYDPLERVVAVVLPNRTWEKVVFDPWRQETWGASDTVLIADPSQDADVGDFFRRLPAADYLPTWFAERDGGALGIPEQTAARKSAVHAATPTVAYADALGRTFLTVGHNKYQYSDAAPGDPPVEERHENRVGFDVEDNQREVGDALQRVVMRCDYDMLGHRTHQASMEAGERWMLHDIAAKPLYRWDSRGHQTENRYDALRRVTELWLHQDGGVPLVVERTVYGETQPNPEAGNLRGKVAQRFDQAGVITSDQYDFKGNLLGTSRRLARTTDATLDWGSAVALEDETYISRERFDALNRPIELHSHDDSIVRPSYNAANLLERVEVNLRGALQGGVRLFRDYVTNIDYDARGQRTLIAYGNGVTTTFRYDDLTHQLAELTTTGTAGDLQHLLYTYDSTGNLSQIRDDAQQTIYFRNRRVEPSCDYTYDALARLIEATGREHLGQVGNPATPHSYNDVPRVAQAHPGDGNAMARYLERYHYDFAGNLTTMEHRSTDPLGPTWTRTHTYQEISQLEPGRHSNRLTITGANDYDLHGNMLHLPELATMQWDFHDQLRMSRRQAVDAADADGLAHTGEETWYCYGADGQRVRKQTRLPGGAVRDERIYLGGLEIYRKNGLSPIVRETLHVLAGTLRVALVETRTAGTDPAPAELIRYQLGNHLGSACLELDSAGAIISYEEYAPYGSSTYQAVRSQTETPKRYRYTGKERDEESGLYYHGARYYAPWLLRWTAADPKGVAAGPNLYTYVLDNPLRFYDPDGKDVRISVNQQTHTITYSTTVHVFATRAEIAQLRPLARDAERFFRNPRIETEAETLARFNRAPGARAPAARQPIFNDGGTQWTVRFDVRYQFHDIARTPPPVSHDTVTADPQGFVANRAAHEQTMQRSFGYRPGDNVLTLTPAAGRVAGDTQLLTTPNAARPTFGDPESRMVGRVMRSAPFNADQTRESLVHETGHLLGFDERYSGGPLGSAHPGFTHDFMADAAGRTELIMRPIHIEEAGRFGVGVANGRTLVDQVLRGPIIDSTGAQGAIPTHLPNGNVNPAYARQQALVQAEVVPFFRGQVQGVAPPPPAQGPNPLPRQPNPP